MKTLLTVLVALAVIHCCAAMELELTQFSVSGNPATQGVDFTIGRPKAWTARRAMTSGALAAFWKAPAGLVDNMTLVVPPRQNLEKDNVTKSDFRQTFDNPQLEEMLGKLLPRAKFLGKVYLDDFKYPAGYLEYVATYKLPDGDRVVKVRNYLIYLGNVMLQVQFSLVQDAGPDRLQEFDAAMKQIVDTLVFTRH